MKKLLVYVILLSGFWLLVGCENDNGVLNTINITVDYSEVIVKNKNESYDVELTDENMLVYFTITIKETVIFDIETIKVNGDNVDKFDIDERIITFRQFNPTPKEPDAYVDVSVSFNLNGGFWSKDILENLTPSFESVITSTNDTTGQSFSLFDKEVTSLRWFYKLFIKYNALYESFEVVEKDEASAQISSLVLPEYDYVIGISKSFSDDIIREEIINYASNEDKIFVLFDSAPATFELGQLGISFYKEATLTKEITKNYNGTEILPVPVRKGFEFMGWQSSANLFMDFPRYQAKDKIAEVNYTAKWQGKTITELENYLETLLPDSYEMDIFLPNEFSGFSLEWTSSDVEVIGLQGQYKRPYQNKNITLTALIFEGDNLLKTIKYNTIAKGYKVLTTGIASSYIYRNYQQVDDLFFETLDIINTAFVTADASGYLSGSSTLSNVSNFIMPRAKENGNWVIMSIAPESNWSSIAANTTATNAFADNIVSMINQYGFDGVDIDWETPTDQEKTRFTALMKVVHTKVKANNPNHLVTTAITGGMWQPPRYDLNNSKEYLDYINIMTYGMTSNSGQYQNALYKSSTFHDSVFRAGQSLSTASIDESVKMFKNSYGITYQKMIVGVAFYGIKQTRTYDEGSNTFSPFKNAGSVYYNHISSVYMNDDNYSLRYDSNAGVPYIIKTDGTEFISFDNPQSILEKSRYIQRNQLGGMMFWEYGTDSTNQLLQAVKDGLGK